MVIAVCDDNELFLKEIEEQLKTIPLVDSISTFSNLDAFMFSIDGGKRYDAVLMDIMWHENAEGMSAATELFKLCPDAKIIYVTGHVEQFSQQIFLHRAKLSGYLTKPVDIELLRANLQKVADGLHLADEPALTLRQQGGTISIPLREINYIESMGHTVRVHTDGETATAYEQLEDIMRLLPPGFCQCHKSYIVNMGRIRRFQSDGVLLKNGSHIPVSRARLIQAREAYHNYIGHKF
jgi:DNA-binding LytR/AlgR family response regulator